ncbi:spermatogenesis-associated protein 48 [Poeciliopsis prolifica]|uniref:spermatogenesis-associated protein 48 n=1 Tax=Poeciliopsis prolifica TaxID=188132 RepID=UPI002414425A|nr:spermatogenesis-associated protein 48 [Poeciliopsis prolifica]
MAAASDPFMSLPTEIKLINRLSSGLCRAGRRDEPGTGRVTCQRPVALAPFRDDVPLLDPCSGLLSAAARVQLGMQSRTEFIDPFSQGLRKRPQTTPSLSVQGSAVPTQSQRTAATRRSLPEKHLPSSSSARSSWNDDSAALQCHIYTSSTQRSYEGVNGGLKFPRPLNAAGATLEHRADPVSKQTSPRRHIIRPPLWQPAGAEWNRRQLRRRNDARKPISFCSRYARSGQIPSFNGAFGSEKMDDIDNMEADFQPLTVKRSVTPAYTLTAHGTTMPGFTGRGVHAPPAAEEASVSGVTRGRERAAPLSRMVTFVTPCNPYLSARLPAWRGLGPVKKRKF